MKIDESIINVGCDAVEPAFQDPCDSEAESQTSSHSSEALAAEILGTLLENEDECNGAGENQALMER